MDANAWNTLARIVSLFAVLGEHALSGLLASEHAKSDTERAAIALAEAERAANDAVKTMTAISTQKRDQK